ncbi:MAG: DUF481 domain-containing protein [Oceanococcus sp.]
MTTVSAQDAQIEPSATESAAAAVWGGKIGLGAIASSGNSEAGTFQADLGLSYEHGIWHNAFTTKALHARSETTDASGVVQKDTTSERYSASLRSALDFSEDNYVFALVEYEKDLFAGVRERSVQTLGYGRRLLNTETQNFDVEVGAGARQSLAQGVGERRESEIIARGGLNYVWKITETSHFTQKITVESGDANTSTESVTELKLAVIGGVYANLGFTWKHNSDVPIDSENVDTISSVSMSWEF